MINEYVVMDLEMTGLSAKTDQIIEIAAIKIKDGEIVDTYACIVNSHCSVPERIVELTGITDAMALAAASFMESVTRPARTSSRPRKIPGKARTLFT